MHKIKFNPKELEKTLTRNSPSRWKRGGFAPIPHELLFDERVSKSALLVFWVLTAHLFKGKECCYPSMKTIGKEARMSRPTVLEAVKRLEELGYLNVDRRSGKPHRYYLKSKV